jgi:hypothetical protein
VNEMPSAADAAQIANLNAFCAGIVSSIAACGKNKIKTSGVKTPDEGKPLCRA